MEFEISKRFKYDIQTGWNALCKPDRLGVEPGSHVEKISEKSWKAYAHGLMGKESSATTYEAEIDEENLTVYIIGKRNIKKDIDKITLKILPCENGDISLHIHMNIGMGNNIVAKFIGSFMKGHMKEVVSDSIFANFDKICREIKLNIG